MENKSQSLIIGLSFLVVGIIVGLLFAGDNNLLKASVVEEPSYEVAETDPLAQLDLQFVSVSEDDDPYKGDEDAPVTIIEFSDYECPYCSRWAFDVLPQIQANYIDKGLVKLVYRDFPLPIHAEAGLAAQAAECVNEATDDEGYFEMHDLIFERSAEWSYNSNASEVLAGFADELGVDIRSCLDGAEMANEVADDFVAGKSYGVSGTPSFFVNGWMVVGAHPYEVFEALIERELNS